MMNKYPNRGFLFSFLVLLIGFFIFGCSTPKTITYFQNIPDSVSTTIEKAKFTEPVIQPDDILSITVQTADPSATESINQKSVTTSVLGASTASAIGNQQVSGFLVDKNGEVELPIIGTLKLAGLTTYQARQHIREKASTYFVNPAVQVRFVNFKITVIGEVTRPASYTVPSEKVTLLDALGLAGDLTIYGKRENILLIRETPNGKETARFNLNNTELFKSPYFYLKQNDIVYVEPNKSKIATTDGARTRAFAFTGTVISLIIVALSRIF
ncbi:polysaccharide biosynthesis/export family protein [Olivibacter ginsenosidimutans]|uniref:Polysaccharide biosynthesis/export family protein n=1 Tax=Olivibacter ginsenosidimutans TaxID=1176537 RepID=A0ABP9ASE9_9SPHI